MVDAVRSDTPTAVVSVNYPNETLQVAVTNPTPTAGRPAVGTNFIWRRPAGGVGSWTLAGSTGNNGVFVDQFQVSAQQFDYFVRTDSGADSVTYTGATPTVTGMWAQLASNPASLIHFPHTDGHSETLDEVEQLLQFVGRQYPVMESGIQEAQTVGLNVTIPFSDVDWLDRVEWWRQRKRDRGTLLYRDGRRRLFAGRIVGPVNIAPGRQGTTVTATLQRVDYASSTTTIGAEYYQAGAYNDGGNGIYGNGSQGNGY